MASQAERTAINAAGLVQGIVLVTFPAASTIFTDTSEYGLSSSQYGAMFLPKAMAPYTRIANQRWPGSHQMTAFLRRSNPDCALSAYSRKYCLICANLPVTSYRRRPGALA